MRGGLKASGNMQNNTVACKSANDKHFKECFAERETKIKHSKL